MNREKKKKKMQKETVDWRSPEDIFSAPCEMGLKYPECSPARQGEEMGETGWSPSSGVIWRNLHVIQFLPLSLAGSFSCSDRRSSCNPSSGGKYRKRKGLGVALNHLWPRTRPFSSLLWPWLGWAQWPLDLFPALTCPDSKPTAWPELTNLFIDPKKL